MIFLAFIAGFIGTAIFVAILAGALWMGFWTAGPFGLIAAGVLLLCVMGGLSAVCAASDEVD